MDTILIAVITFIVGCAFGAKIIGNEEERLKGFQIGYACGKHDGIAEAMSRDMPKEPDGFRAWLQKVKFLSDAYHQTSDSL